MLQSTLVLNFPTDPIYSLHCLHEVYSKPWWQHGRMPNEHCLRSRLTQHAVVSHYRLFSCLLCSNLAITSPKCHSTWPLYNWFPFESWKALTPCPVLQTENERNIVILSSACPWVLISPFKGDSCLELSYLIKYFLYQISLGIAKFQGIVWKRTFREYLKTPLHTNGTSSVLQMRGWQLCFVQASGHFVTFTDKSSQVKFKATNKSPVTPTEWKWLSVSRFQKETSFVFSYTYLIFKLFCSEKSGSLFE